MEVREEEPEDKVVKLGLAFKESKKKITVVQFEYEVNINELQLKLQSTTPQEVSFQREAELKLVMVSISTTMVNCNKLLDERLKIWTSLQQDLNIQKLQEEMQQRKQQLEER